MKVHNRFDSKVRQSAIELVEALHGIKVSAARSHGGIQRTEIVRKLVAATTFDMAQIFLAVH